MTAFASHWLLWQTSPAARLLESIVGLKLVRTVAGLLGLVAAVGFVCAADAAIIVSDTFDVGAAPTVGDDPDDPLDIAWVSTKPGSGQALLIETISGLSGNTLRDQNGFDKYRATVGQLPERVRLESVGDTLSFQLKFKQRVNFNEADAYRLGIVDSGGAGYFFRIGSGTQQAIAIVRDDGTGVALDDQGLTVLREETGGSVPATRNNIVFDLGIDLTRTVSGLQIEASIADYSLTYEHTLSPLLSFDAVAVGAGNTNYDWHIDDVIVDVTVTPVPEPSTLGLAVTAVLGLSLCGRLRRKSGDGRGLCG